MNEGMILNEKEARTARARLDRLATAMSSKSMMSQIVAGLPAEVVQQVAEMIKSEKQALIFGLEAYEAAKSTGDVSHLMERSGSDPGLTLIVARIAQGYSQKELASKLGLKEQQVQRYEADRYSTISLKNYKRIAVFLGVSFEASLHENPQLRGLESMISSAKQSEVRKILKHGRQNGWFSGETDRDELRELIAEQTIDYGSPSLLRTGFNVLDLQSDLLLNAWRAQVSRKARKQLDELRGLYDQLEIGWLTELVGISPLSDGPLRAKAMLRAKGILLIVEPQIPGLKVDGAAFLYLGVPIVALTIRRDSVDNFWFTLLHELAHVVLHYRTGLSAGFYDDSDLKPVNELEKEADEFASNMLIPEVKWRGSLARIAKTPGPVKNFASQLGINPAIVFGRLRKERDDFRQFTQYIGSGTVRSQFVKKIDSE